MEKKSDLIIMGDLHGWKNDLIVWVTYPGKNTWRIGVIVMGDLPRKNGKEWSHCNG